MGSFQSQRLTSQLFVLTTSELFPLRMTLLILCKNRKCGFRHASALQMDQKSFRVAVIENNSEKCPKCDKYSLYNKRDYFFGFARINDQIG
jgi:hypothetical protein